MDNFSKRLKSLRLSMNLSQKQFGILGDVSDVTQGYYESDDPEKSKNPSMSYLLNLKENEVDIYYLLTGEKIANNLNQEESLLLETFRNSNPQNKKLLLELCGALSNSNEKNDKKKDDQDPPVKSPKNKIKKVEATNFTQSGSITTNNNFVGLEEPNQKKAKFFGSVVAFMAVMLSCIYFLEISIDKVISFDTSALALLFAFITFIGTYLYKFIVFPIHYEIDLWFHKKK